MPILRIPTPLRTYAEGQSEITVAGSSVAEAMRALNERFPALQPHLFNGDGELRPYVNLFLNDDNIRDLQGVETPLEDEDRLRIIPSIAGGQSGQGL